MITSPRGNAMIGYLPPVLRDSSVFQSYAQADGEEFDLVRQLYDEMLAQFFVDTATWSLDYWEDELGLTISPNKPTSDRQSVIKSKLRGTGTVTVTLLQSVAQAYDNGLIEVTQHPALCSFTIKFVDTLGIPPNLDDLKAAIEEIKPAHLAVEYAYRYLLISEVQTMTIDQMESHQLYDFAPFIPA